MKLKAVFFCGHQSQYGLAHLIPLTDEFDIKVVIIGTDARWNVFRQKLIGEAYYANPSDTYLFNILKSLAKKIIPAKAITLFRSDYRKPEINNIQEILRLRHIELWEIFDVNSENSVDRLKKIDANLFISAAYPQIFSKTLLNVPHMGAVNFHPSLLPKYRGAHPHFWQILHGEKEGGVTAHFMTENIDDGDIIAQLSFPIEDSTYADLYRKIIKYTPQLVREIGTFFKSQTMQTIPQRANDSTCYRNDREIHHRIFWNIHTSQEINNLIRTGSAFCFFRGKKIIFNSSYVTESNRNLTNGGRVENGAIVDVGKNSLTVKTMDGCINIKEIKGRYRHLSYLQWAKSVNLYIGEKFD